MEGTIQRIKRNIIYFSRFMVKSYMVNGIKLCINFPKNHEIPKQVISSIIDQEYEFPEMQILKETLKPSDKVLELGTGLGFNTIFASKVVGDANVVTYEANPNLIPVIEANKRLNDCDFPVVNKILSHDKTKKMVNFNRTKIFWTSSVEININHNIINSISVETENINDVITANNINYLLVDIEGGEYDIFNEELDFEKLDKICLELHPSNIGAKKCSDIVKLILNKGFIYNMAISGNVQKYFYKE